MNAPYLHIRKNGESYDIQGDTRCMLGHRISDNNDDGIYCEWQWLENRLIVSNDRYGFYPVYYFSIPDEFAISTSLFKLVELGASVTLDEEALSVFFRIGFFINDDTPFKLIKAIPPCSKFEWIKGKLNLSRSRPVMKENHMDWKGAIDGYISLLKQSIKRRIPKNNNFAVPLSGGKDSRHILLELHSLGYRPEHCVTTRSYSPIAYKDDKIAALVTKALSLKHVILDQYQSRIDTELRKNQITNFCSDEHTWFMVVADYLEGKVETVYDGIGGDVLTRNFLTEERIELFQSARFNELASHLMTEGREKILKKMFMPKYYHKFSREMAIHHLGLELKHHINAPNPIGSFFFTNRTRREVALCPYGILQGVDNVYSPYLDKDLYDFLASLSANFLIGKNLQEDAMHIEFPEYSSIPFAKKMEKPLVYDRSQFRRFAIELLKYSYKEKKTGFIRPGFLLPRILRSIIDSKYSINISWFGPFATYLIQFESFCRKGSLGFNAD